MSVLTAASRQRLPRAVALSLGLAGVAGSTLAATTSPVLDRLIDFQQYRFGVPPPDFVYDGAGPFDQAFPSGRPAWRTYVDLSAPSPKMVLIRSAPGHGERHPMAVLRDVTAENVNLVVSFKLLSGDADRSAGLLWRAQGTNDYRSVLVSAVQREVRLLRTENGRPKKLVKEAVTFDEQGWNFLEVSVRGDRIAVWLNERSALEARDTRPASPGRVGLITGQNTVALFDDFHVQSGQERIVRKRHAKAEILSAPVLHVTEVLTTHSDFKTPCRSFRRGGHVRWRVHVAGERRKPSPAAVVECELAGPDGKVFDRDKAMTGTDGAALFTRALARDVTPGTCTVRVKGITHADMLEATCSSPANLESVATFEVTP